MREAYHKVELHKVTWEVPEKYKNLAGIGSGAYGQVLSLRMITRDSLVKNINNRNSESQ